MLFDLLGKTAFVTGASSGLGERISQTLAQYGAHVILGGRDVNRLETVSQKIQGLGKKSMPVVMDVSQKESIEEAVDTIERTGNTIDILVNCAGIAGKTPIFSPSDNTFERIIQTNLLGLWHVTRLVANHMRNKKIKGSIINISSVNGLNKPGREATAYSASKAGVIQLTRVLVGELSPYEIRINAILPGLIHTPMTETILKDPALRDERLKRIPLGFIAEPEDFDGAILFLASNKASRYVTGSTITLDGGASWGG